MRVKHSFQKRLVQFGSTYTGLDHPQNHEENNTTLKRDHKSKGKCVGNGEQTQVDHEETTEESHVAEREPAVEEAFAVSAVVKQGQGQQSYYQTQKQGDYQLHRHSLFAEIRAFVRFW